MPEGKLRFVIETDDKGSIVKVQKYEDAINNVGNSAEKTSTKHNKFTKNLIGDVNKMVLGAVSLGAVSKAFSFISESVNLASAAMEQHSKLNTIFSDVTAQTEAAVSNLTDNYGLSTLAAEKMLASTGDLLTGLKIEQGLALELSDSVQKWSVDIASFTDLQGGAERASMAMTKAMLGQREMLSEMGVSIYEVDVQQRLLEKGQQSLSGTALKAAKAQATLELAMEQSKNAMGDFARTQDSFANQSRILDNTLEDLKVEIGKTFMDIALPLLKNFSDWVKENKDSIIAFFKGLADVVSGAAKALEFLSTAGAKAMDAVLESTKSNESATKSLVNTQAESTAVLLDWLEANDQTIINGKIVKKTTENQTKAVQNQTEATKNQTSAMSEAQKIANKYDISLQSANKILETISPEIKEAQKLQKELNISNEEAVKLNGILTELEKKRKDGLKETNYEIKITANATKDLINAGDSLVESLKDYDKQAEISINTIEGMDEALLSSVESTKKANEELKKLAESDAADTARNLGAGFMGLKFNLEKLIIEINEGNSSIGEFGVGMAAFANAVLTAASAALQLLSNLGQMSDRVSDTVDVVSDAIKAYGEGGYAGAIASVFSNADKLTTVLGWTSAATRDLTVEIEQARQELEQFGDVTDETATNWANFIDQVERGNYEISEYRQYLQDINQLQMQGADFEWSTPFVSGDLELDTEAYEDYMAALQEAAGLDPGVIFEKAKDQLAGLNNMLSLGARGQGEFNDQVTLTLGTFTDFMRSGKSITETLMLMGDSFDQLLETQKAGGFEASELFTELSKFRTLIKDNEDLVKAVEGYNAALQATAELGPISQERMSAFARQANREFEKLTKAGFSENQALQMLAPSLKALEENAARYGTKIDENTQKMIDQAREAGMFEDLADPMDTMLQVMIKIGEVLGADMEEFKNLGEAATIASTEATEAATDITESFEGSITDIAGNIIGLGDVTSNQFMNMADDARAAAADMADGFRNASDDSLKSIKGFVDGANKSFGNIGNFGIPGDFPAPTPPRPQIGFANGTPPGGYTVPGGFPTGDKYLIGLNSGEKVYVEKPGDTNHNYGGLNMNFTVVAERGDSPEDIARKLVTVVQNNPAAIIQAFQKAGVSLGR